MVKGWSSGFKMNSKCEPIRMQGLEIIPNEARPDHIHRVNVGLVIPG